MAERLSDLEARIDSIGQLSSVVTAYRGIAAARLHEAQERLDGIRGYAATVADAIGQALGLMVDEAGRAGPSPAPGGALVIVLCSEQGFVGNFNARLLDEAQRAAVAQGADGRLLVVGQRGAALAAERDLAVARTLSMAAHADEVTALGNRLSEALYDAVETQGVTRAAIVHAAPGKTDTRIVARSIIPFDFARFPQVLRPVPFLHTLPLDSLLARLAEEYVFAELCEAAMLSYAAENEKRMMTMLAARGNVRNRLDELTAQARRLRQEEITAEVTELAAGVEAGEQAGPQEAPARNRGQENRC